MWEEEVPEMEGKFRVCRAEACDEVVFEGAYCAFSGIVSVCAGGNKLKLCVLLVEVVFECLAAFVVKGVQKGFASMSD